MTDSRALATVDSDPLPIARQVFGDERMSLIRALLPDNYTAADIADVEQFAITVGRTKLDFFSTPKQIYAIRRWDTKQRREVLTAQASIDSFRLVAARTREYQGQVGPFWCGPDGVWQDVWLSEDKPKAARVGVRRKGFVEPVWSVAVWDRAAQWVDEYQGSTKTGKKKLAPFWEKMGPEMLAKTAETNALKRAFPNDTEGLELAAIATEERANQAALAQRYVEIHGSEETGTFYDQPAGALPPLAEQSGREADQSSASRRPEDAKASRTYDQVFNDGPPTDAEVAAPRDVDTGEVLDTPAAAPERPKIAGWQRNRQLVAEAQKRKLTGFPTLNARSSLDVVEAANTELQERIRNYDLDQQLTREQQAAGLL